MNKISVSRTIPLIRIYQKLIVLYVSLLIIGNLFKYEPPYYVLLVVSILVVFFSNRGIDESFFKNYLFLIIISLYGLTVAFVTGGGIGGPITIVTGLMVLFATQKVKFDKNDVKLLVIVMLISIGYWLYRSPTYYSEFFYNHWKGDGTYTNSNGVGHYLAYECSFMFMIMSMSEKRIVRILKWLLAGAGIWGCYNVKARMALVTILLFILMCILTKAFPKFRYGIIKGFLYFSIILEILFPFFYLMLYRSGIGTQVKFFGLAEKGLYSGRESIWQNAFDEMQTIPKILFGVGSRQNFWKEGLLNMHNNAMNLYVVIGAVGLVVYFLYLIWYIKKEFKIEKASELQIQCLIFFICILVEGTTDVTIFYNPFLAYYFIPLGIALNSKYNKV